MQTFKTIRRHGRFVVAHIKRGPFTASIRPDCFGLAYETGRINPISAESIRDSYYKAHRALRIAVNGLDV